MSCPPPAARIRPRSRTGRLLGATIALVIVTRPLAAEPVSIGHDGLKLNAEWMPIAGQAPERPVVLLLHGILSHHQMTLIANLQRLLAERKFATLAISLGFGIDNRSGSYDCRQPHRHRPADALDELDAWLAWLQSKGVRRVVLLGHSLGGNQVARFAVARDRTMIAALVLVAPGTWTADGAAQRYETRYGVDIENARARAGGLAADSWLEDIPFLFCGPVRVTAGSFLSYHGDDPRRDTPSLLPQISKPTLVIAGSVDESVPDVAQRTAPYLDADTKLVVIDGADHFFRDFLAEDAADAIAKFLQERR